MSDSEIILGLFALVLVVFSLVVALVIPRRDPDFPGRRMPVFIAVAILLVVAMLAAVEVFGAEEEHGEEAAETMEGGTGAAETGATETGATQTGGEEGGGDAAAGEEIFASAGCGSCHTLEEAGTEGTVGPNLDDSQIDEAGAVQQITGGGGGMPPFAGELSEQEIQDVAAFVVASEG
jgi:mono/diheme cytochrome c family protein